MCYSVRCELFYHHFTNLNTAEEKKTVLCLSPPHGWWQTSSIPICTTLQMCLWNFAWLDLIWISDPLHAFLFYARASAHLHSFLDSFFFVRPAATALIGDCKWTLSVNWRRWILTLLGPAAFPGALSWILIHASLAHALSADLPSSLSWGGKMDSPIDLHWQSVVILMGIQKILLYGCMLVVIHADWRAFLA